MSDLLDKLNVLLRASLNNLRGSERTERGTGGKITLGKDVDREVAALRTQINTALDEEEKMKTAIARARQQVTDYDMQADNAVSQGEDMRARQILAEMQRLEARIRRMEADLERHERATFDLIQHVNTLDAMVAEARGAGADEELLSAGTTSTTDSAAESRPPTAVISDVLRGVRERVESAISTARPEAQNKPADEKPESAPAAAASSTGGNPGNVNVKIAQDAEIEADLAKRRARLSKPD